MSLRSITGVLSMAAALGMGSASSVYAAQAETMFKPVAGAQKEWTIKPALTVGETVTGYQAPGILDGLGAYSLGNREGKVRVLANHELGTTDGYGFSVRGRFNTTVPVSAGARVSYFDIDQRTLKVSRAGLAISRIYDRKQRIVSNMDNFEGTGRSTLARLCSSSLYERHEFSRGRGVSDRVYITGEEDGGPFSEFGGGQWALDPETFDFWAAPALGRGGWENVTQLDTGEREHVAFILSDDTAPFVIDADPAGGAGDIPFNTDPRRNAQNDGAPLYLYIGRKSKGDFLDRNGLKNGRLYVWTASGAESVADFNGTGNSLPGRFVAVENFGKRLDVVCPASKPTDPFGPVVPFGKQFGPSKDGFGYASQRCLWYQARTIHRAFQFSRPEDVSTNPARGTEFVLASTGRSREFDDADAWGTVYTMDVRFKFGSRGPLEATGVLKIVYDANDETGNAKLGYPSKDFGLRSADNLDWTDEGLIYVQEDAAIAEFGSVSRQEASIWRLDPRRQKLTRIAQADRSAVLDASTTGTPFDKNAAVFGAWESSGILDVSALFGRSRGNLLIFDVQAHGIEDQTTVNADSEISDANLKEGGQLLFLERARNHNRR